MIKGCVFYKILLMIFMAAFLLSCARMRVCPQTSMEYAIYRYGLNVAKTNDMKLLIVGDVTEPKPVGKGDYPVYCMSFSSLENHTLDKARVFATNLVNQFEHQLKQEPTVRVYAKSIQEFVDDFPLEPELRLVGYKIAYWDENFERRQAPLMAEMQFYHEKFHYYQADPKTQALHLVFEESYEDALQFLREQSKEKGER